MGWPHAKGSLMGMHHRARCCGLMERMDAIAIWWRWPCDDEACYGLLIGWMRYHLGGGHAMVMRTMASWIWMHGHIWGRSEWSRCARLFNSRSHRRRYSWRHPLPCRGSAIMRGHLGPPPLMWKRGREWRGPSQVGISNENTTAIPLCCRVCRYGDGASISSMPPGGGGYLWEIAFPSVCQPTMGWVN